MDEAQLARVKAEMSRIRRREGGRSVLVMLLCIPVLAAGIALMLHFRAAGHPRLANFMMGMGVIGAFVPLIAGGMIRSRMNQEMLALIGEPLARIRRQYIVPFDDPAPIPADAMFRRSIPRMNRRALWCEQGYYRGLPVAVSRMHFWRGNGDSKEQYNRIVLTLPIGECSVSLCHSRCFDLLLGRDAWQGAEERLAREERQTADAAIRAVIPDAWTNSLGCRTIEERIWREQRVMDIALTDRQLFRYRGRLDDPEKYLQWYQGELQQLCSLLDAAMTLPSAKKQGM